MVEYLCDFHELRTQKSQKVLSQKFPYTLKYRAW